MAHRILTLPALPPPLHAAIATLGDVDALPDQADRDAFLAQRGADYTIAVTHAGVGANAALMDRLPHLRAICSLGVGHDTIDLAAAQARGIAVSNTPDVLNDCVADLAMGLLIDVARGLSAADRHVRRGDWLAKGPPAVATRVSGKRLGLLGMGRIGRAIAKRATGFSMQLRYHSRSPKPDLPWAHEPSLQRLADWADFLVVACTGGAETRHLVSAEILRALGPRGCLVNIARGSVVDEAALVQVLQSGQLGGAGLDVFDDEPHVPLALFELDQVVLLPHIGSATRETRQAMMDLVVGNVRSFIDSGRLLTPCVESAPR